MLEKRCTSSVADAARRDMGYVEGRCWTDNQRSVDTAYAGLLPGCQTGRARIREGEGRWGWRTEGQGIP